jgi:hypothetical protein
MLSTRNKTKATAIATFLALTIAVTIVALPIANAHTPPLTLATRCYAAVGNSVIGVNQQEFIYFWTNANPPTAQGAYGDRWTFTVEVTKPDGSNETLGPYTSDPIGGSYILYTPTQVGTYSVVAKFPGKTITGLPAPPVTPQYPEYVNDTYLASTSDPVTFIVQQEPIQPWPEAPLPTQFWTRPINEANRNWACIAGDWLAGAAQNVGPTTNFGYGTGPESAHIMWATPMWAGGLADARFNDLGYTTTHYEGLTFTPPIILNGKLYYNVQSLPKEGWYCLDLYTGEVEYFHNTTGAVTGVSQSSSGSISGEALAFGQILNFECPNQHGVFPYLWSTTAATPNTWMMFDAFSGNYMCSIANVSAGGTAVYGKDGSILRYNIVGSGANKRLTVWNTTLAIWWKPSFDSNNYWLWRPGLNVTYDGRNGFSLNASIPDVQGSILAVREDEYVIGGTSGKNNGTYVLQGNLWALNLKPDANGVITPTLLWNITYTPPQQSYPDAIVLGPNRSPVTGPVVDPEDGVFTFKEGTSVRRWGYSLETGQLLWTSEPEIAGNYYGWSSNIYQGMLLSCGYGGVLYAYDIKTGKVLWNYTAEQVGFESPYGNYPILISCIADGKIYLVSGEHSTTQPMWRGSYLRCINASNGVELWKVLHWGGAQVAGIEVGGAASVFIADGFLVGVNFYDNQIYCYGKGPSATTVTASPKISVHGSSVLIEGSVTDQSPSTKGTPAISDADQEAWMEYIYAKQEMPKNATGVEVSLDTLDPNGNFVHIETATSDESGLFSYKWTPEVPGKYTVIASFVGSNSYYGSYAETAVGVDEAPPVTPPPEYPQPYDYTMHFVYAVIAIIIAVAIVGIWIKRK